MPEYLIRFNKKSETLRWLVEEAETGEVHEVRGVSICVPSETLNDDNSCLYFIRARGILDIDQNVATISLRGSPEKKKI